MMEVWATLEAEGVVWVVYQLSAVAEVVAAVDLRMLLLRIGLTDQPFLPLAC